MNAKLILFNIIVLFYLFALNNSLSLPEINKRIINDSFQLIHIKQIVSNNTNTIVNEIPRNTSQRFKRIIKRSKNNY